MTQTVFLRLDTLLARASQTGTVLPAVVLTLCSSARVEFAFINAEDVVGPITGDVVSVQCGVKKAPDDEDALLLTDCAENEGEGVASRRLAEWSAETLDNDNLRALLGSQISVTGSSDKGPWMEIIVTSDGKTDRFSFPITLKNAFIRPDDVGPDPRVDASWTWLKQREPEVNGFIHDDESKTIKVAPQNLVINAQTDTSYTLALVDNGAIVTLSNASAITLTVPTNASVAFPIGAQIFLRQKGAGQVTIAAAGVVTLESFSGNLKLAGQYAGCSLIKEATNTWSVQGNLSA